MRLITSEDLHGLEECLQDSQCLSTLAVEIVNRLIQLNSQGYAVQFFYQSPRLKPLADLLQSQLQNKVQDPKIIRVALGPPPGLNADTGSISEKKKFHITFALGWPLAGFYLNQGPQLCGRLFVVGHTLLKKKVRLKSKPVFLMNLKLAKKWLPKRGPTDNKTHGGRTLIWAGQTHMPGAALLSARSASRVGAGYIYLSLKNLVSHFPEAILWDGYTFDSFNSILMGPGLGVKDSYKKQILKMIRGCPFVVLDADALTISSRFKLGPFPKSWVITPHAGELSRLLGVPAKDIESNRLAAAQKAQAHYRCTVVLKGFHTVVALEGITVIVPTGNVSLAKGGSGDVLAGIIAGLISQKLSPQKSALLGCYIHGLIADQWIQSSSDHLSLTPSDLVEKIPSVLTQIRKLNLS